MGWATGKNAGLPGVGGISAVRNGQSLRIESLKGLGDRGAIAPLPCYPFPVLITNSGIDIGIEKIDRNTEKNDDRPEKDHQSLYCRIISRGDRLI